MNWYSINFRILWWTESSKEQHLFEIDFLTLWMSVLLSLCWIKVFKLPFQKQKATQPQTLERYCIFKITSCNYEKIWFGNCFKMYLLSCLYSPWLSCPNSEWKTPTAWVYPDPVWVPTAARNVLPHTAGPPGFIWKVASSKTPTKKQHISTEADEISLPRAFEICITLFC